MAGSSTDRSSGVAMAYAEHPRLCVGGCGFFGTPEKQGMCSQCYVASPTALTIYDAPQPPSDENRETKTEVEDVVVVSAAAKVENKVVVVKKGRCGQCNKKVGLLGFDCKCGDTFCGAHRYPHEHACGFDFKDAGKKEIQTKNPVIKADKIEHRI